MRYTDNQDTAEKMANKIYEFYDESHLSINNSDSFVLMQSNSPVSLGTDEKNIYEYTIEIIVYEKKGSK